MQDGSEFDVVAMECEPSSSEPILCFYRTSFSRGFSLELDGDAFFARIIDGSESVALDTCTVSPVSPVPSGDDHQMTGLEEVD
jgi:hypothetical protein